MPRTRYPARSPRDACSYCKDLSYAEQLQQPFVEGQYVDYNCVLPISRCMIILLVEAVVYFLIALYLDNVLANESGVRRRPWCALLRSGFRV